MNFLPPEPDERALAWQRLQDKMAVQIMGAKEKWMRQLMKRVLPDSVFKMAYSKNHGQQKRVAAYLFEHMLVIQTHPDKTVLVYGKDERILGEFKVEMQDKKLCILCRNSKNLPKLPEP